MKILFVFPNILKYENISFGIASLSACLKTRGHETGLIDFTYGLSRKKAMKEILKFNPDLIGFSTTTGDFSFSSQLASEIKNILDVPILFGGVHPTIEPEESISQEAVDMICIGEGEEALCELVEHLETGEVPTDVKNIWVKKDSQIFRNPVRPLIQDLDSFPHPDRDLFKYEKLLPLRAFEGQVMVGRGCPYQCSYCINPILQDLYRGQGRFVRYRSVERIIDEVKQLIKRYPVKCIYFVMMFLFLISNG
ncbi:MAG: cobalamin-dependent protein [Candidatus Theseobacter exili]|nr:cobalamin-dependent protein [Candidatus Theseobacter exili]